MPDAISGLYLDCKNAGVSINEVSSWRLQPRVDNAKYGSNTGGVFKRTTVGCVEWTAVVNIYFHDGTANEQNPFRLGLLYAVQFHADLTGNNYYSGNVRVVDHGDIQFDKNTGEPVSQEVTLEGHGVLTANGAVSPLV